MRYFCNFLYSTRAYFDVKPNSVTELVISAVSKFSRNLLLQSVVSHSELFPKADVFQHLMMDGLSRSTNPNCQIIPEISSILGTVERLPGELDFFVNGEFYWGIELLIGENEVGKHLSRFANGGKYNAMKCLDYIVVDFRVTKSGEPSNVFLAEKRATVFFKSEDFSRCIIVCNELEPITVELML